MAQILIKAQDNFHDDPIKDQRGCWKRGYIVAVMDDEHEWGKEEGPPIFLLLDIPDVKREQILPYAGPHKRQIDFNPIDKTRFEVVAVNPSPSGRGMIEPVHLEESLTKFNLDAPKDLTVVFDPVKAIEVLKQDAQNQYVATYDAVTETTTLQVVYDKEPPKIDGEIVSDDPVAKQITYVVPDAVLMDRLKQDLKERLEVNITRCRYTLSEEFMSQIEKNQKTDFSTFVAAIVEL